MRIHHLYRVISAAAPFAIIGSLLYAGLFIKIDSTGTPVARPDFERGDMLYGLDIQSSGKVFLVGSNGKILISLDAGNSWRYAPSMTNVTLQDVTAWDDNRAVAVGNDGVVVVTGDGGKSWMNVVTPKSKIANKLIRVKAISNGQAWAVGEGGIILRSSDYGINWVQVRAEEDTAWNDIFTKDGRALVVGERGRILISNNNGDSWREVKSQVKSSLMSVAFRSMSEGVAVGLDGVIVVTKDGGETWQRRVLSSPEEKVYGDGKSVTEGSVLGREQKNGAHLLRVIWEGDRWFVSGTKGIVVTSGDGEHWNGTRLSPEDRNWYTAVASHGGKVFLSGGRFIYVPVASLSGANLSQNEVGVQK